MKRTLLFVVLVVVVSACGSDAPATDNALPSNDVQSSSDAQPTAESAPTTGPTAVAINEDSPIEALLGVPVFDDDAMNDWFRDLDIERQRMTAECMIAEGFEFVPETPRQAAAAQVEFAVDSREYAAAYGFGIGHAFNAAEYDPTADYSTANSRYFAGLSDGEAQAYEVALYGPDLDEGDDFDGPPQNGCAGQAFQEVFSVLSVMFELSPVVDGYYEQFLADARMIELTATWQQCMSAAGFVHATPDDMVESFYPQLDALTSDPSIYEDVAIPDDFEEPADTLFGDSYSSHPKLTADGQAQLDAFIANEIATAVAHWDCHDPQREEELAIQREYEASFVAEVTPLVEDQLAN